MERFYSKEQQEVLNTIVCIFIISVITALSMGMIMGLKLGYDDYEKLKEQGLKLEYLYYDKDHNLKWKDNK